MTFKWKAILTGLAAVLAIGGAPSIACAVCGDINSNSNVEVGDPPALAAKLAGFMGPTACGGALPCAVYDVLKDGFINIADLSALSKQVSGLKTLFDPCTGPGTAVSCTDGTDPDTMLPVHNVGTMANPLDITANERWPNTCTIHILGTVFVRPPAGNGSTVVTIDPGTIVKGVNNGTTNPSVLIFLPGTRIDAQGTFDQPIIMTSGQTFGMRHDGDWGGLLLNGKSTVNRPNCVRC